MSFDEFACITYPNLYDQYELYLRLRNNPDSLIGIEVIAVRSGFSCGSDGGTRMIIDKISDSFIHFSDPSNSCLGWGCKRDELHTSVKLADPDLARALWYNPSMTKTN